MAVAAALAARVDARVRPRGLFGAAPSPAPSSLRLLVLRALAGVRGVDMRSEVSRIHDSGNLSTGNMYLHGAWAQGSMHHAHAWVTEQFDGWSLLSTVETCQPWLFYCNRIKHLNCRLQTHCSCTSQHRTSIHVLPSPHFPPCDFAGQDGTGLHHHAGFNLLVLVLRNSDLKAPLRVQLAWC